MDISDRIFSLLLEKNIKQQDLAEHLGVRNATVSQWKTNKIQPSIEYIAKIANFLGCTSDYLIFGKKDNIIYMHSDLTEYEKELIEIYNNLSMKRKNALLSYAYQLEEEEKSSPM